MKHRSEMKKTGGICCAPAHAISALLLISAALSPAAASLGEAQTFHVLHEFTGGADGAVPQGVTLDDAGNVYGVALEGGRNGSDCYQGCGVAFELSRQGSSWLFGALHTFQDQPDGASPAAPMVFGPDGALYGSTVGGGLPGVGNSCHHSGCGTIFRLQPPATPCEAVLCLWQETVLYRFTGGADGSWPDFNDAVIFDRLGNLYATAYFGGYVGGSCATGPGCGVVFELTPSNGGWSDNVLYSFHDGIEGAFPSAGVIFDQAGNLYGTNDAAVYELSRSGSGWTYNVLVRTEDAIAAGVIFDPIGRLYSATADGGLSEGGTAFTVTHTGDRWVGSVIYNFPLNGYPAYPGPAGTLLMDRAGNLYGTTSEDGAYGLGTVFKLSPNAQGSWTYTDLHDFTGGSDGDDPAAALVIDQSGDLFGTAQFGGTNRTCSEGQGCGVLFEITP